VRKLFTVMLTIIVFVYFCGCSSTKPVSLQNPVSGESVSIVMKNGKIFEGVLLKKEGTELRYVDVSSHKPEKLVFDEIRSISKANKKYDFEGNIISEKDIDEKKGITKTLGYGFGGIVLGAAAGFGVGLILAASNSGGFIYPMIGLGLAGGIYFGLKGSDSDYEDAFYEVRRERYEITREKLKKELADEKQKLEEQKLEKEKLLKELKSKKKDSEN